MSDETEDRRPQGGFFTRQMPPKEWDFGETPSSCYDNNKSRREIEEELLASYLKPENVQELIRWLEWRDRGPSEFHTMEADTQIHIAAEIDAHTLWAYNIAGIPAGEPITFDPETHIIDKNCQVAPKATRNINDSNEPKKA